MSDKFREKGTEKEEKKSKCLNVLESRIEAIFIVKEKKNFRIFSTLTKTLTILQLRKVASSLSHATTLLLTIWKQQNFLNPDETYKVTVRQAAL